jgi:hypothetical protein
MGLDWSLNQSYPVCSHRVERNALSHISAQWYGFDLDIGQKTLVQVGMIAGIFPGGLQPSDPTTS